MRLHSVTCCPIQVNAPRHNSSQAGRYLIYLPRRDERLSWLWWSVTYCTKMVGLPLITCPQTVTRPGSNRARSRASLLLNALTATPSIQNKETAAAAASVAVINRWSRSHAWMAQVSCHSVRSIDRASCAGDTLGGASTHLSTPSPSCRLAVAQTLGYAVKHRTVTVSLTNVTSSCRPRCGKNSSLFTSRLSFGSFFLCCRTRKFFGGGNLQVTADANLFLF